MSGAGTSRGRYFVMAYFVIALAVAALDQAAKAMIAQRIPLHDSVAVIPGFFSLSHVLNRGAAFSLFANASSQHVSTALIAFSLAVMAVIAILLVRGPATMNRTGVALSLILGGALGNVIDRVRLGSVVDFLAFDLGRYHWPDFNLADSAIVCGSLLLMLDAVVEQVRKR